MKLSVISDAVSGAGMVYRPEGKGPFPGIMILHGSEGGWSGWSHRTAVLMAAHGFITLPFSYSRNGNYWNSGDIIDIPLENTIDVWEAFYQSELTGRAGVLGSSRGAEHALLMTSLIVTETAGPLPDALAVHSAPDVICGGFRGAYFRDKGDPGWTAWDPAESAWCWQGSSENLKPSTPIELECYPGPLFLSHGEKDSVWSVDMTKRLEARLVAAGRAPEVHYYPDQDHIPVLHGENIHHQNLLTFFERYLLLQQ